MEQTKEKGEVLQRNALVGGGRYDGLVRLLGGKDVPASGAAAGVERIVGLLREMQLVSTPEPAAEVFLAQLGDLSKKKSLKLLEDFRKAKIQVAESLGRDSLRTQLARADKLKVAYTLILGQKEVHDGTIIIRDMDSGNQEIVDQNKLIAEIKKTIKTAKPRK